MDKRAAAFAHYNDAAVLQMLIEVLPQIAKEVAAPMAAIDQLTVVSTDGAGALPQAGHRQRRADPAMLKTTTGIDLQGMIERAVAKATDGDDEPAAAPAAAGHAAQGGGPQGRRLPRRSRLRR